MTVVVTIDVDAEIRKHQESLRELRAAMLRIEGALQFLAEQKSKGNGAEAKTVSTSGTVEGAG